VTEDLSQSNKVITVVCQKLVGHCVTAQVWVKVDADDSGVFTEQGPNAAVGQRPSLTDEDALAFDRRAGFQVCLQGTSGRKWQRDGTLFAALPKSENHDATSLPKQEVREFEVDHVAHPGSRPKEEAEDCPSSHVLP
jgi:hypothetical protein